VFVFAFVEDIQIPLLPAPSQGAIEKPSRDGMALKTGGKSMPVRAKIEDEQQGEQ
jgi:hypothetical protein